MRNLSKACVLALFGVVSGWGCSGCTASNPNGTLSVVVLLPAGATGSVTVTGPSGYSKALTASTALSVPPGAYSVTAARTSASIPTIPVEYTATVTGSPATVAASAAAQVTVTYAAALGTGNMWLAGVDQFTGDAGIFGYAFQGTDPQAILTVPNASCPAGLALDSAGGLWVTDPCMSQIDKYSPAQLAGVFGGPPAVTLANNYDAGLKDDGGFDLSRPVGLAFDSQGNLWVTDVGLGRVIKYANPSAFSGRVVTEPTAILVNNLDGGLLAEDGGVNFYTPFAIAFDSAGDLWLASSLRTTAVKYSGPSAMTGLVAAAPAIVLSNVPDGGEQAFLLPGSMAFDSQKNLWLANALGGTVTRLDAVQLTASGAVQPTLVLADAGGALIEPAALAFDQAGNLWVTDRNSAMEFTSGSFAGLSGRQDLDAGWVIRLETSSFGLSGVALDPTPTNLPLPQQH